MTEEQASPGPLTVEAVRAEIARIDDWARQYQAMQAQAAQVAARANYLRGWLDAHEETAP